LGSIFVWSWNWNWKHPNFEENWNWKFLHKSQEPLNTGKDLTSVVQLSSSCNPNWKLC
jgi:hypothetical protein